MLGNMLEQRELGCVPFYVWKMFRDVVLTHADFSIAIKDASVSLVFLMQTLGNGSHRHSNEKGYQKNPFDLLQLDATAPSHLLWIALDNP